MKGREREAWLSGRCVHIHPVPLLLVNKEPSALYVGLQTLHLHPVYFCVDEIRSPKGHHLVSLIRWLTTALEVNEKYIYPFTFIFHLLISVAIYYFFLYFQVKVEFTLT